MRRFWFAWLALLLVQPATAALPFVGQFLPAPQALVLHEDATEDSPAIATVGAGEAFEVLLCVTPRGWCRAQYGGLKGWFDGSLVSAQYDGALVTLAEGTAQYWSKAMAPAQSAFVLTKVVAWGDSLTLGAGNAAGSFTDLLQRQYPMISFENDGVGSQTSSQIAARMLAVGVAPGSAVLIWAGRNNIEAQEQVLADVKAMVDHVGSDKFLVGSVLTSDDAGEVAGVIKLNDALRAQYGAHFVDIMSPLLAAADAPVDQEDVSAGIVPRSLRVDNVHLNDRGYSVVAKAWAQAMTAMGWLDSAS